MVEPPTAPTQPEPSSKWDKFDPTNEKELTAVALEIIGQMKHYPGLVNLDVSEILDMVRVLNGVSVETETRAIDAEWLVYHIITRNDCYGNIRFVLDNEKPLISWEKIPYGLASKQSDDYLSEYEATRQPIIDAARNRDRKLLMEELVRYIDRYYGIIFEQEEFLDGQRFEDLPLEVRYIILREYRDMHVMTNHADMEGLLNGYDIRPPQSDPMTRVDKINGLLHELRSSLIERALPSP